MIFKLELKPIYVKQIYKFLKMFQFMLDALALYLVFYISLAFDIPLYNLRTDN